MRDHHKVQAQGRETSNITAGEQDPDNDGDVDNYVQDNDADDY